MLNHIPKSGVINFKSQQEINEERQEKMQSKYRELKKNVQSILDKNSKIVQSVTSDRAYDDMLTVEEGQKIFELKQEINRIYAAAKERYIAKKK
ncbi:hypothetical protein ACQCVB_04940 [Fictibacillus phosphorivorans]|uniref:hypothetical protein n=1 Tax=Fictibacillus phosphorivorans TaxID=1221500 RepID=UPI003CF753CF